MDNLLPVLEACTRRPAEQTSHNYAADLHRSLNGDIGTDTQAAAFFDSTHATDAMRRVAHGIFDRLRHGDSSDAPAVIRFNSVFGGGKTHTLIALAAAAKHPKLIRNSTTGGLLPPDLAPDDDVRLVCFTGENADVLQGMAMDGTDRRAKTLTGYLAYHLGGTAAYDMLKPHDDRFSDPGADGFQRLIGDRPTLILLDELVRWVAAAKQLDGDMHRAGDGLRNALTAIAKAVSNSPRAVLVVTTPEAGHDAYQDETQQVHQVMRDVDSVISRTARDYTPTETTDFPAILRRRLFKNAENNQQRQAVADAYAAVWHRSNPSDTDASRRFYDCYPFHPETLRVITERLTSNNDFQRVRGTLRAISAVIHNGPEIKEPLIHPYHLDVSIPAVREELVHRTGHQALDAAIQADVNGPNATAKRFDTTTYQAANIILLGSLAPTANNGLADTEIVNGLISPISPAQSDHTVAMQAVQNMKENGLYIDDDPQAGTTRFNRQANVRREVEQRANAVGQDDREKSIQTDIGTAFSSQDGMRATVFPSRINNVPDDPNSVHIGIINPNHVTMQSADLGTELESLYSHSSLNGGNEIREHKNNVIFLVADNSDLSDIEQQIARHKAASEMLQVDNRERKLLEYQRAALQNIATNSWKAVYQGIQRNWVHLYYPQPGAPHGLEHARLRFPDQEGRGHTTIVDFLTSDAIQKMAHPRSPALSPNVWAEAGLRRAGWGGMTVGDLHSRFTRAPGRKMFLMRAHFDRALDTANAEGDSQVVVVRTPHGMDIKAGSGVSYRNDMQVWLKDLVPDQLPPPPPPPPGPVPWEPVPPVPVPSFTSPLTTGQVAVAGLQSRMASDGLDWNDIANATLYGTNTSLLNDLASKAQANGAAVVINYSFGENGFEVSAADKTAEEWQQCRRACEQMQRAASATVVDAQVSIAAADNTTEAVRTILHDLDNTHQITLEARFRQPAA